jgi:hypothetical protein
MHNVEYSYNICGSLICNILISCDILFGIYIAYIITNALRLQRKEEKMKPWRVIPLVALLLFPVHFASQVHATPITYTASLGGANEQPPVPSTGIGFATVVLDQTAHTLSVEAWFSDLIGVTTAAHIHAPTASPGTGTVGVATQVPSFGGFPLGVSNGTYSRLFDLTLSSSWNISFLNHYGGGNVLQAEAEFAQYLADGRAYFNIHTTFAPAGEIRGFLSPVPEPSTVLLLGSGLLGLVGLNRRRRK